jgi:hypothetical protein
MMNCRFAQVAFMGVALLVSGLVAQGWTAAAQLGELPTAPKGAKLLGKVSASGTFDAPRPLRVFKNRTFCGASVANETLLIGPTGGLTNAVVTLNAVDRVVSATPGRTVLDNQRCAFVPHVQVATLGSDLLLKNSDPILHAVHARMGRETLFNVGLPRWRQVTKRLDRPGVVRIDCDVLHTWMSAVIIVATTPYFAVTDLNGNFVLDGLPAGTYDLQAWHERLGSREARIGLPENGVVTVEVLFSSRGPAR